MKKKAALFLSTLMTLCCMSSAFAADGIIVDGRTLVPVRGVFESFGFIVNWEEETSTAYIHGPEVIAVEKGQNYIIVGDKKIYPDVPQQIIDGKFYLPLRVVGDAIGAQTSWNGDTKTAVISYNGVDVSVNCGEHKEEETPAAAEVSVNSVYSAYNDVLAGSKYKYFELIYVDNDDIPELACYNGGSHLDQIDLYTYYNGEAVFLDSLGAYGTLPYSERNNRMPCYSGIEENEELEAKYTYMIENGQIKQAPDHKGYELKSAGHIDKEHENTQANRDTVLKTN